MKTRSPHASTIRPALVPWVGLLVAFALATGLGACKSNPKKGTRGPVARGPVVVQPTYPPPAPTYPPPAPIYEPSLSQAELDAAHDAAEVERQRREQVEQQLRLEQDRLADTQTRLDQMEARIADLQTPPAGPLPDALPLESVPDDAIRLADELRARSQAEVLQDGDLVVVRMTNGFRAGSDLLKSDVQLMTTLNATADALARYPGASVAVVGHSDADPIKHSRDRWQDNDQLSFARAERVAQVLSSNGVDQNRISIDGRGAREPLISPERSAADKARNRRVEILIRP